LEILMAKPAFRAVRQTLRYRSGQAAAQSGIS